MAASAAIFFFGRARMPTLQGLYTPETLLTQMCAQCERSLKLQH
ncbi:hypothetical protein LMIY3S_04485 [Labrys miyagiensis]